MQSHGIADWLQERRKVEDQYVQGLRKLIHFKVPNASSELGIFQVPWDRILATTDAIAHSHQNFAQRLEHDVEAPLRTFGNRKEMQNIHHIAGNLLSIAKDFEDAQHQSDKLTKKGAKASTQKVQAAAAKLESASQQWEAQAPFVYENLQALDELRCNQLRDLLTQYQTHESDQAQRTQAQAADTLNIILETSTDKEIQSFAQKTIAGKPKLEKRSSSARPSIGGSSSLAPASVTQEDDHQSDHVPPPLPPEPVQPESKLRRLGTMLGRRRQSIHGGFGQLSPGKGLGQYGTRLGSSHGRISPRSSSNNLTESANRLSSLAESPTSPLPPTTAGSLAPPPPENTNGVSGHDSTTDFAATVPPTNATNGVTEEAAESKPDESSTLRVPEEPKKDAEGFTIPTITHDPISQAEKEAADEAGDSDQFLNVNIQREPIADEDPDAKKAALSNVAHTLTTMGMPSRKTGTIRGRREVRSTIYIPPPHEPTSDQPFPPSPALPPQFSKPSGSTGLVSEASIAATSDTQSVRSGNSLMSLAHFKHPDMHGPGLNSSIIESVSASFENGEVTSAKINGEIAFQCNDAAPGTLSQESIRINNFTQLEAIGPNRIFVQSVPEKPDEFTVEISHMAKTTTVFNYRVHSENATSLAQHVPLVIKTVWKPAGDKIGLLLQYSLNPQFTVDGPVSLRGLTLVATYEGKAAGVQSKPPGTHLKDRRLVYWRLGDVALTAGAWEKIVCRVVGADGTEPKAGHVEAKWEYSVTEDTVVGSGISVSRLEEGKGKDKEKLPEVPEGDPFADENTPSTPSFPPSGQWVELPSTRKLISGKYEAR